MFSRFYTSPHLSFLFRLTRLFNTHLLAESVGYVPKHRSTTHANSIPLKCFFFLLYSSIPFQITYLPLKLISVSVHVVLCICPCNLLYFFIIIILLFLSLHYFQYEFLKHLFFLICNLIRRLICYPIERFFSQSKRPIFSICKCFHDSFSPLHPYII